MSFKENESVVLNPVEKDLGSKEAELEGGKVNTGDLSGETLEDQKKLDELNTTGKFKDAQEYKKTLESINNVPENKDKNNELAREAHRKEFINSALQMMIDNLQSKVDEKGLFGWMNPKVELNKAISGLIWSQRNNDGVLNLAMKYALQGDGLMVDNKVRKQIAKMVKEEFGPEDQIYFTGDESIQNQVHRGMSEVTKG